MNSYQKLSLFLIILILILSAISLSSGSVSLDWHHIRDFQSPDGVIFQYRISKSISALFVGMALPISGMLLQEYFKNVLAGPSIMGVSSSAGLGISLLIFLGIPSALLANEWLTVFSFTIAGLLGALSCLLLLLSLSKYIKDKSNFIIIGFLISALTSAIISVLQLYSGNSDLKQYVVWSFGSFSGLSWIQLSIFGILLFIGVVVAWKSLHNLQGNILGEQYAKSVGVNLEQMKYWVLIATSILTGVTTSMVGPIAFVGIIVPFFCRMIISEAKLYQQFTINLLMGMALLLLIGILTENLKLPINIITSFLGIPMIAYIVLKSSKVT